VANLHLSGAGDDAASIPEIAPVAYLTRGIIGATLSRGELNTMETHEHSAEIDRQFDELYETYGKPLEAEHRGEFLAVSADGRTVIGPTLRDVASRATESFGPGNFLYRIGEPAVGKWR
jgi:hypothetical protein